MENEFVQFTSRLDETIASPVHRAFNHCNDSLWLPIKERCSRNNFWIFSLSDRFQLTSRFNLPNLTVSIWKCVKRQSWNQFETNSYFEKSILIWKIKGEIEKGTSQLTHDSWVTRCYKEVTRSGLTTKRVTRLTGWTHCNLARLIFAAFSPPAVRAALLWS